MFWVMQATRGMPFVSTCMLRMHGGAMYIYPGGCPFAYFGMVEFDFTSFRPIRKDVKTKANHVRMAHVSGVSNATVLDLRLAAAVVASVLEEV
jgi:predicted YcjX-like family ATPase